MVTGELLVVKKNDHRQIDRISIEQVHQRLGEMIEKCAKDQNYAIGQNSRLSFNA